MYSDVKLNDAGTTSFLWILEEKYKNEYACALKIKEYIKKELGKDLEEDELIYLVIHIKRITND
ncbi:PRD domain-containing protein [Micrococcus luteus]|uniref:PRD domain-containing protein n=1 Tax=Micrococcus luteus TaxID=1270 RepID=UPI0033DEC5FD